MTETRESIEAQIKLQGQNWNGLIIKTPQTEALAVGDLAYKVRGSYEAFGKIIAAFKNKRGEQRYVFELDGPDGGLRIFRPEQVVKAVMPNKSPIPSAPAGRGYGGDELRAKCNPLTHEVVYDIKTMQHKIVSKFEPRIEQPRQANN